MRTSSAKDESGARSDLAEHWVAFGAGSRGPECPGCARRPDNHRRASVLASLAWIVAFAWAGLFRHGLAGAPEVQPQTLIEWTFDREGDQAGWHANDHFADVRVVGGALECRGAGTDPILELGLPLEVAVSHRQALEVRLKASRDGTAEFFWSNTTRGRYGGFSQEKTTRFPVVGDNAWATYRVLPGWQAEGRIIRLRLDLYDNAEFAIDAIRIVSWPELQPVDTREFEFPAADRDWPWIRMGRILSSASPLAGGDRLRLGPTLSIDAEALDYVSMCMTVPSQPEAGRREASPGTPLAAPRLTLWFAGKQDYGFKSVAVPVHADGQKHVYDVDMLVANGWRGQIVALGIEHTLDVAGQPELHWLKIADRPQGPARLSVVSLGLEPALPRVGKPLRLEAVLANHGGALAGAVTGELVLPDGLAVRGGDVAGRSTPQIDPGGTATWEWALVGKRPVQGQIELRLRADQAEPAQARMAVALTEPVDIGPCDYVPEPRPVRGPYEVGVYYFPGWKSAGQWHPIRPYPERRPVLGWYREGDPEVADWHIKWAVEHGITFFAYDWYWSQGARQLEHALHDGYFKARYRRYLKFCLLWANHNAPGTSSHADCVAVTRHWIEHYFRQPEHLTVEGKPLVIIFSPDRLSADLGSTGVKSAFDAMRATCREAGFPGLLLVACVGDAAQARQAAAEGYDAVTAYNWPGLDMSAGQMEAPYAALLPAYRRNWQHIIDSAGIPLLIPLCGGWDSRPWHGANNLVRYGRTPELFRQHAQDAAQLSRRTAHLSPLSLLLLVEAWNEFGEGSYIEPHQEFGFGYLDALRDVFTAAPRDHVDVTPPDVGRGPYDVAVHTMPEPVWEFRESDEGWSQTMDLTDVRIENGALIARSTGNDPALFGPPIQARADAYRTAVVRMKLTPRDGRSLPDRAQLFWRTDRLPEGEASSERFDVLADGAWHEYRVDLSGNRRWRGIITRLRLDPCNQRDTQIALDVLRLEP